MFRNVKSVELVEIPLLEACVLPSAFKCVEELKIENGGKLEGLRELKELVEKKRKEEEERRKEEEERERKERERKEAEEAAKRKAVIRCKSDWDCVNRHIGMIEVSDKCCNEEGLKELDLSGFVNLRELKVGNECFMYVDEVKLIGLSELENVEIGENSFTKEKNSSGNDPNRHFYLKDCPKLKSLNMGCYSFSDYSVFEIENVNALEVIEIGDLKKESNNFLYASLELKSILIHSK